MSNVVLLLHADHRNVAKLLGLIQQQTMNMAQRAPVNYRLLQSILEYLSNYADQCHHPKEDLLYRKLLRRHPAMAGSLKDLVEEHEKIAQSTGDLMGAVCRSQGQGDLPAPNERLADQLTAYMDLYRRHMLMEEQYFFAAALQRLSRDDFEEIDFTLFDRPDPLFDPESEKRYAELRDEIARTGALEGARDDTQDDAAWPAAFQGVTAFNQAMQRTGDPTLLVRSPAQGYELQHKGKLLVHIPACSESRAAWCAYYYWKGRASGAAMP
jgi:hemerythrin-like domain-containing protein